MNFPTDCIPVLQYCRVALVLGAGLLLAACVSLPKEPVNELTAKNWAQYQLQAGRVQRWHLHGRAAIFVNDEVHNVGLNWENQEDYFIMTLEAPFGQGVIRIETSTQAVNSRVKLSLPDGRTVYGESAEATLREVTGWSIPVSGLVYWIKGLPQKNDPVSYDLNGDGRLNFLLQNGWRVNYLDYFDVADTAKGLPRKIYLKRDNLALKIVIDSWQKPEVSSGENPELFPEFN